MIFRRARAYEESQPIRVLVVGLSARTGGGGSHLLNQIAALSLREDVDLTVHAAGAVALGLRDLAPAAKVVAHPPRPLLRRLLFEQTVLAWEARYFQVVYVPGNLGLLLPGAPQVVCQQNAWYYTEATRAFRRRCPMTMRARLAVEVLVARTSVRRARAAIAVSQTMRHMIEADLGALPNLRVVASAAPDLRPMGPPPNGLSGYVLAVAPDDPHKDFDGLVEAFVRHADLPPLVIAGRCSVSRRESLHARANGRVQLLGQVDDRQAVANLYGGARCLLAHSYFESFGLTPAEALQCGTPVAATDIPAHREVCGDRASYYQPDDRDSLAAAVRAACEMPPLGREPAGRTWNDNATELVAELRAAAITPRPFKSRRPWFARVRNGHQP